MRVTGVKIESSKTIHTVIIYIRHLNYLGPKLALACSERLWLLVVPWRGALGLGGSGARGLSPLLNLGVIFGGPNPPNPSLTSQYIFGSAIFLLEPSPSFCVRK